jgi:hypothetical protein
MLSDPARITCILINVPGKRSGLAQAASSPREAAASAAISAAAASAPPATSAASASATTAGTGFLHHSSKRSSVLLVEGIERCQAHVGNFLFTKCNFVTRCKVGSPRLILYRRNCSGCASHQRKSQPGGAKHRYGLCHTLSFRSLFHPWHSRFLHVLQKLSRVPHCKSTLCISTTQAGRACWQFVDASFEFMLMNESTLARAILAASH